MKALGIKVLIVEPGAFRTPFANRVVTPAKYANGSGYSDGYKGTAVEQMFKVTENMKSSTELLKGDPDKAAQAIVKAVNGGHEYLRLPLGKDCVVALQDKIGLLTGDLEATRDIASATDAVEV